MFLQWYANLHYLLWRCMNSEQWYLKTVGTSTYLPNYKCLLQTVEYIHLYILRTLAIHTCINQHLLYAWGNGVLWTHTYIRVCTHFPCLTGGRQQCKTLSRQPSRCLSVWSRWEIHAGRIWLPWHSMGISQQSQTFRWLDCCICVANTHHSPSRSSSPSLYNT